MFEIVRDSECTECGAELPSGSMLFLEAEKALCLACAGMGDLEFLPAGDMALTRRATKYSGKSATVVRFSRSRGRYERQGILVETPAIEKAEAECTSDAEDRAKARARAAELRVAQDQELVQQMTARILALFPRCTPWEARAIAAHTATEAADELAAARLAAIWKTARYSPPSPPPFATIIQTTMNLLASGADRQSARERVGDQVREILAGWRGENYTGAA